MFASRVQIAGRRFIRAVAVTVSVVLVCAGVMRASGIAGTDSSKQRSPRAVIGTAAKDGPEAGSKKHAPAATCQSPFILPAPDQVASFVQLTGTKTTPITSGRLNARAPPIFLA